MRTKTRVWWFVLVLANAVAGCGPSGPVHVPVHGQVTLDGRPAEAGVVRFVPVGDESGPARASVMAAIASGEYQVQAAGGLQEGRYRVEVEVQQKTGKKTLVDTGAEQIETDEMVAVSSAQYAGEDSPLTYTAEPGADTRFDIDVPTK